MGTLTFDGRTTATIQIGARPITLRGRIGGAQSKSIELAYHATTLEDAIDLGGLEQAVTDLMRALSLTNFSDFKNLLQPAVNMLKIFQGSQIPLSLADLRTF